MTKPWAFIQKSLILKLIATAGLSLVTSVAALSYFAISHQEKVLMRYAIEEGNRLGTTIRLGTRYAMMTNSRNDLHQIVTDIGRQENIKHLRIYDKAGLIQFSSGDLEGRGPTKISEPICQVCHRHNPPLVDAPLAQRMNIFQDSEGRRVLGIISPIHNEPGCEAGGCHFHPPDERVLGVFNVALSLDSLDREAAFFRSRGIAFTLIVLTFTALSISIFMGRFVIRPIRKLITGAQLIADGGRCTRIDIEQPDEMGTLVQTIERMGASISEKQAELNRQRDEYHSLFSSVPCIITVQDRDFRLLRYNKEFRDKFKPKAGDTCYLAYKGRTEKCPNCPVEKTFATGESYTSEETGVDVSGERRHWLVTSSPIKNAQGEVVAAMEMCLDITSRKQLEDKLEESERKYQAIFRNIPNPVFVLDEQEFTILDCNESVPSVYGFKKEELIGQSFLTLFPEEDREQFKRRSPQKDLYDRAIHISKDGRKLFVTIRVSPSEFSGQKVLLVTTSDITKRLETEQQLIQASKMATLGEMATGVAHELNQPLSVIKTAASYIRRKQESGGEVSKDIMNTLTAEMESHVDRASKIINHLREFGRKPEMRLEPVAAADILLRALDIFSQQLALREIEVVQEIESNLPLVHADSSRLEQVFINMLINARDAIEDRWAKAAGEAISDPKRITLSAYARGGKVMIEIADTGSGIPSGVLKKIFEPFFTTKPVGRGTGLGLSISYGIIQDCGGNIQVRSEQGRGTRIIISLPIPTQESADG